MLLLSKMSKPAPVAALVAVSLDAHADNTHADNSHPAVAAPARNGQLACARRASGTLPVPLMLLLLLMFTVIAETSVESIGKNSLLLRRVLQLLEMMASAWVVYMLLRCCRLARMPSTVLGSGEAGRGDDSLLLPSLQMVEGRCPEAARKVPGRCL